MKIKKQLPKIKEEVTIPAELLAFLKDNIYRAYIDGKEEATMESDDMIQNEIACGGLIDSELKKFIVSYYPAKNSEYVWSFEITLDKLKEISEGKKTTLTLWGCTVSNCQNKEDYGDFICLLHDFTDDGTGESELVKNIHKLSVKEMLDLAYGPKKNKPIT